MEDRFRGIFATIVFALLLVLLLLLMSICATGCRTVEVTREVPVVTEHTTVQHHVDLMRDTLMTRDSVYHFVQGDTVIIERWHQVININRTAVADTVRDTIPKVVTVTRTELKEVNRLHWWQRALMWMGAAAAAAGAFFLGRKLKK